MAAVATQQVRDPEFSAPRVAHAAARMAHGLARVAERSEAEGLLLCARLPEVAKVTAEERELAELRRLGVLPRLPGRGPEPRHDLLRASAAGE